MEDTRKAGTRRVSFLTPARRCPVARSGCPSSSSEASSCIYIYYIYRSHHARAALQIASEMHNHRDFSRHRTTEWSLDAIGVFERRSLSVGHMTGKRVWHIYLHWGGFRAQSVLSLIHGVSGCFHMVSPFQKPASDTFLMHANATNHAEHFAQGNRTT